jgi:hypothetical protein
MGSHPISLEAAAYIHPPTSLSTQTVTVYTIPDTTNPAPRTASRIGSGARMRRTESRLYRSTRLYKEFVAPKK